MDNPQKSSSHIPVLEELSKWNLKSVVEMGMGQWSTPTFRKFTGLSRLVSYESDAGWFSKFQDESKKFTHHLMLLMPEAEALGHWINDLEYPSFEMAFVDGAAMEMRLPTAIVASMMSPIVVVHDMENHCYKPIYQFFKASGWNRYTYKPRTGLPHTAVFTKNENDAKRLKYSLDDFR